jgi:CheY-like chemotaxis protein
MAVFIVASGGYRASLRGGRPRGDGTFVPRTRHAGWSHVEIRLFPDCDGRLDLDAGARRAQVDFLTRQGAHMESPRVLVVDDHVDSVDTLVLVLGCVGYDARGAYTGREALGIATQWVPWAALLDLAMPSMSGFELASELKKACSPQPLLFAVSGLQTPDLDRRCQASGFARLFVKPCDPRILIEVLDRTRHGGELQRAG